MASNNKKGLRRALTNMGGAGMREMAKNLADPGEAGRSQPGQVIVPQTTQQTVVKGRTDIFTHFTTAGGQALVFSAPKWTKVQLLLETAGPVVFGTRENILPVLGGKGALLLTNIPREFTLSPGDRLYIAATAGNRVQIFTEPYPWLEQMVNSLSALIGR
ncbi:MAG: hypothetical protein Q8S00_32355 [Deltaproteobacteria bacterium]|nr:hypothetical protein [Deltaproteobacteria bacterium]